MGKLDFLAEKPSDKVLKWLMLIGLVIFCIAFPVVNYMISLSGDTTDTFASQLSFSGDFLTEQYGKISNMDYYRLGQTLDYLFMVGYGILWFSLALFIARKHQEDSIWRRSGYWVSILGGSSAIFDALENAFIFATLQTPTSVPNSLAIAHSTFALIKWILMVGAFVWIAIAAIFLVVRKK